MTVLDGDRSEADAGVMRTALGTAMSRAKESLSRFPLFTDPYAQLLVDAAGPVGSGSTTEESAEQQHYAAARTKWFDEFFVAASSAGVSQVVILAPGLDTRAWRLPWLDDTVIYEVDEPHVLEFKQQVIEKSGVTPSARRVPVALEEAREDWPKALTAVGFDYTEPTAWASEGLVNDLDAQSMNHLLEKVELYSARGSRIAVESQPHAPVDVSCWLCERHWEVKTTPAAELITRYHRAPATGDSVFVAGRKL
ncbi:SAM-dependent methyltransferase [Mycobacterium sp. 236(2023)]|uniref:SAM-dependent methyltransferase n=1 Tax=Mycobacterium sp. 236(2023) TaxID=3038163 RepID=UPI003242E32C